MVLRVYHVPNFVKHIKIFYYSLSKQGVMFHEHLHSW